MRARLRHLFEALRTGRYMDHQRAIVGAGIFGAGCLCAALFVIATSDGVKDFLGRPLGTDFIVPYAAGKVALKEGAAAVYDVTRIFEAHQAVLNEEAPFWGPFLYPPAFIPVAAALASLPYAAAWLFWMAASGAGYVAATAAIARFPLRLIPILGFSAVFMNFMQGQTGFLVAALFGGGLVALFTGRSILAGVLFGLVALKPQYGLLIPVALFAARDWRAFGAAAVTVVALAVLPTLFYGADIWDGFAASARIARIEVLEKGGIGFFKIISVFAQARMWGAPIAVAYAAQAAAALFAAFIVFRVWRSDASDPLKGAALILAALLAGPYVIEYDLLLYAPAVAFIVAEAMKTGFRDYEKTLLVVAFLAPALNRSFANYMSISPGLLTTMLLLTVVLARVRNPAPAPSSAST